jgi:hypothetical protein
MKPEISGISSREPTRSSSTAGISPPSASWTGPHPRKRLKAQRTQRAYNEFKERLGGFLETVMLFSQIVKVEYPDSSKTLLRVAGSRVDSMDLE